VDHDHQRSGRQTAARLAEVVVLPARLGDRLERAARRLLIGLAGSVIVVLGLLLIITPGPAFLVIPAGLGVLALEFETSRCWRERLATWARAQRNRIA